MEVASAFPKESSLVDNKQEKHSFHALFLEWLKHFDENFFKRILFAAPQGVKIWRNYMPTEN